LESCCKDKTKEAPLTKSDIKAIKKVGKDWVDDNHVLLLYDGRLNIKQGVVVSADAPEATEKLPPSRRNVSVSRILTQPKNL
jgi:hypothetical protein